MRSATWLAIDGRSVSGGAYLLALLMVCTQPVAIQAADLPASVVAAEKQRIEAIERASRTAVSVFESSGKGGGSGVVISPDGYALTNFHVTQPCGDYMRCSMADGQLYDAVIVSIDPVGDVALIKLLGRTDFPATPLGDSEQVRVGDWCFAVGNPFLLATDLQPTVSYGLVSGVHRYQYPAGTLLEYADCLQTDAAINPGNSGGPLFDAEARLIGVNGRCSFEKRGRVNVGVGYAISVNQLKNFMGVLHSGRVLDHATLGATVSSDPEGRVIVTNILESSDAYRRGLRFDDEIVSFAGRPIGTTNAFKNALGIFPKGWRVPLEYRRGGERKEILVRLSGVHSEEELLTLVQARPAQRPAGPPGRKPQPEKPQPEKPDDKPKEPQPMPEPMPTPEKAAIPEAAAKWIVKRTGYTNYFFNELHRNRVWNAFTSNYAPPAAKGTWNFRGKMEGDAEFHLAAETLTAKLPKGLAAVELAKDLSEQLEPANSGGLLLALFAWQRLLRESPNQFGDMYYYGTAPYPGQTELCEVMIGTFKELECHFYFHPRDGKLLAMEMYPESGVDPCEIVFDDYRELQGGRLPHRMEVRFGDNVYGTMQVDAYEFTEPK